VRVLVTGGAGYIGSFTTRALVQAGHDVVVYDNLSFGHRCAIDAKLVVADIADTTSLKECLHDGSFEAIVHFAAFIEAGESMRDPGRFFRNNTANTAYLLAEAIREDVQYFIFSSTAGVYGNPTELPITEKAPTIPTNVYSETKLLVERMLPWFAQVHDFRSVALRYFNCAGGALDGSLGQDHEPASHIITLAMQTALGQRDKFLLFGEDYPTPDGTCIRDYIHVLDLAAAHLFALEYLAAGGPSEIFNVGAGRGYTNREVLRLVKQVSGIDFLVEPAPRRPGDPTELVADSSRIRATTGWRAQHSDLETIVSSAWAWHSSHPKGYDDNREGQAGKS
jgi:UDP-glucose 4-epimerase